MNSADFFFLFNMTIKELKLHLWPVFVGHVIFLLDSTPHGPGSKSPLTSSHKKILNTNHTAGP